MSEPFLKVYISLFGHPKIQRLGDQLHMPWIWTVGYVTSLWKWALIYAIDGDLSKYSPAEIASAAGFEPRDFQNALFHNYAADSVTRYVSNTPDDFLLALIDSGFVTRDKRINDWEDHQGNLIERRRQNRERQTKHRLRQRLRMERSAPLSETQGELATMPSGGLSRVSHGARVEESRVTTLSAPRETQTQKTERESIGSKTAIQTTPSTSALKTGSAHQPSKSSATQAGPPADNAASQIWAEEYGRGGQAVAVLAPESAAKLAALLELGCRGNRQAFRIATRKFFRDSRWRTKNVFTFTSIAAEHLIRYAMSLSAQHAAEPAPQYGERQCEPQKLGAILERK